MRLAERGLRINGIYKEAKVVNIGLIADTHMPGTIDNLWPQVHDVFESVDCSLHAGDLHVTGVIEELETIAPTFVAAGNGDIDVRHPRLKDAWVGDFAGLKVAMVHRFPTPRRASSAKLKNKMVKHFGGEQPDVVIYGHTHLAELHEVGGCLYVNPGSATLPNNQSTRLGTLGVLSISGGSAEVSLHQLTDEGVSLLDSLSFVSAAHHSGNQV